MKLPRLIISIVFVYGIAVAAMANTGRDLKRAQQALATQDYEQAFQLFSQIAHSRHDPLAQFSLAFMLKQGLGRPVDFPAACHWFEQAAKGDIPTAAHEYANCLHKGIGPAPVNFAQAAIWYKKAAELGSYTSYCSLGKMYMLGQGLAKNPEKALQFCQMAAEKGNPQAIVQLGLWRLKGPETIRDTRLALQWFSAGAKLQQAEPAFYLGQMMRAGLVKEASLLDARYWFEQAASQGYRSAYLPTGELYLTAELEVKTSLPTAKNLAKSYLWLTVAERRAADPQQQQAAAGLLKKVMQLMPASWQTDLDPKIAAHLAKY